MLEKPDLPDQGLIACLRDDYGLEGAEVTFLPLGADVNTAVYRAATAGARYFLKLRRGAFDETAVAVPQFLSRLGIAQIIPPLETRAGQLRARVNGFTAVLYPFVAGHNAYEVPMTDGHWCSLAVALRGIHSAVLPPALSRGIARETFTPHWRNLVRQFQARIEVESFVEPVAARLAEFMRSRRAVISHLVERAILLGSELQSGSPAFVLCHGDIHAGNMLIDANGALFLVDWDTLIYAPREHDLMFVGGGGGSLWQSPHAEMWFYEGYSPAQIDRAALVYYRYERIVQDIAAFCQQLLLSDAGGPDRERSLHYFTRSFGPGSDVEVALAADRRL